MKKNKSLFIVLSLLIVITVYFYFQNSDTTLKKELRDFAVKDTAAITKIFIANRNGNKITLERNKKKEWLLNGKDEPRPDLLKFLLDGIYKIDIRNKVAKAAYNNVIKTLAASGIKCEIYLNDNSTPKKTYYVGGQTEDGLGTFMMIENSNVPFVTEVPGFNGYLTPRYSVDYDAWKQPKIFHLQRENLKSLSVSYTNYPEKSFTIISTDGKYKVESVAGKSIRDIDSVALENYLSFYKNVFYETRAKDLNAIKKDSILQYPPSIIVSLSFKNGLVKEVDIYPMLISASSLAQQDANGNALKYDLDRMYGYMKPEKEFVVIQHYTFDKLLRQYNDFDIHRPKEARSR